MTKTVEIDRVVLHKILTVLFAAGYPRRGTWEEGLTIQGVADMIQQDFSREYLEALKSLANDEI